MKITTENFGKKNSTRYIYFPGYKYCEAESYLNLRSCLIYSVINSSPSIGKYINKIEFYNKCPPIRVKNKNMSEIENYSCVITVMNLTTVLNIEGQPWGASSILRKPNDEV